MNTAVWYIDIAGAWTALWCRYLKSKSILNPHRSVRAPRWLETWLLALFFFFILILKAYDRMSFGPVPPFLPMAAETRCLVKARPKDCDEPEAVKWCYMIAWALLYS